MTEQRSEDTRFDPAAIPHCEGCGNEIDPEYCWCGDAIKGHSWSTGHGPVPMGCVCGRAKDGK